MGKIPYKWIGLRLFRYRDLLAGGRYKLSEHAAEATGTAGVRLAVNVWDGVRGYDHLVLLKAQCGQ